MSREKVYVFGTCLVDTFFPESGIAAIELLELCGYEVVFPDEQTCCGQPPYNSGHPENASNIAWQTIELFNQLNIPVVVPSASCAGMIKHHYPKLFQSNPDRYAQACKLAERTFELIDFIIDKLPYERLANPQGVTSVCLHTSCSAKREMQVSDNWQAILSKLPGVSTNLPRYDHECCGFGGTFAVKSEQISACMASDKAKAILDTNSDSMVTGDCGCLMNIQGVIEKQHQILPCTHIANFILAQFKRANSNTHPSSMQANS